MKILYAEMVAVMSLPSVPVQIHLLPVAFPAAQLHTLVGPLCIPGAPQTLERVKGSLGTKSCLLLRPEIQITQGAGGARLPRGQERPAGPPGRQGRASQPWLGPAAGVCCTGPAREQGRPRDTKDSPSPGAGLRGAGGPERTEIVSWAKGQAGEGPREAAQDHH